MEHAPTGLARTLLASLFIGLLIAGGTWVMAPFLPALIWATMIVVATWPLLLKMQKYFKGSRKLAVLGMMITMSVIVLVPLGLAVYMLVSRVDDAVAWLQELPNMTMPPAPPWLEKIPLLGLKVSAEWTKLSLEGPGALAAYLRPYAREIVTWIVNTTQSAGLFFVHLLLTLILSGILYATGEKAALGVTLFARRIADDRGESSVILAGQSIKAVALGIVVTAVAQSILGGFGLWVAGVPFAGIITALMFMFCIAQLGPLIPLLIGVAWLYSHDHNSAGTMLLVWTLIVGTMDNFLRPILIRRGADLPLLLILAGVLGGLFAFGVVGLFIGPMVLAVSYRLLEAWVGEMDNPEKGKDETPLYPPPPNENIPQEFLEP